MFIGDFHIHSHYSRATSGDCRPEPLELYARRKGLQVIGSGDFTHPAWREELAAKLVPAEDGLYRLRDEYRLAAEIAGGDAAPRFMISGEISTIYKKNGRTRKVHHLILLPSLAAAATLSARLERIGNLHSDGRPILGLDSRDLLEITLDTCPEAIYIPAHIWTPHFSLFGAYSGFDSIEECFEDLTPQITALETGLSSDPPMNWRLTVLDRFILVSNSDAHSPDKLAREANLFNTALSYDAIRRALREPDTDGFLGTLEFFPAEGKYHYDGHRNCKCCLSPAETIAVNGVCPVCGGQLTVGVSHRVEQLADRPEGYRPAGARRFESLAPLSEVIAASTGCGAGSVKTRRRYDSLLRELGPELYILREAKLTDIEELAGPCIAEGVRRLRAGEVRVDAGYDGEYGKVHILDPEEIAAISGQTSLFAGIGYAEEQPAAPSLPSPVATAERKEKTAAAAAPAANPYGLNREQWQAVADDSPAIAVIAGPGTGKTRTLVCRIAHLVAEGGVAPEQITAVTFTNKAAREMRERLEAHFGDRQPVSRMQIGTFHSICLKLLRSERPELSLIDEYDALRLAEAVIAELQLTLTPAALLQGISREKNAPLAAEGGALSPAAACYQDKLRQLNLLDFDDILLAALTQARSKDQQLACFTHLLVDEFQDINPVQYHLLQAWSGQSASLFVIGDPDQAIYGFRGADDRCFDLLRAERPQTRSVRLTRNYRSRPEIIACALPLVMRPGQAAESLLQAERPAGEPVNLWRAETPFEEALLICKRINALLGGVDMLDATQAKSAALSARSPNDIAILYRTHRQAELLEQCLRQEGIPYRVAGRGDFLADQGVRRLIAYFRRLLDADQAVALTAAALLPAETPAPDAEAAEYRRLLAEKTPPELVRIWIDRHYLGGNAAMEQLHQAALGRTDMRGFLHDLLLGEDIDIMRADGNRYRAEAVTLLTLHGAKGLEFPVVFLAGLREGLLPLKIGSLPPDVAEEKRLFYVGVTRAQDDLYLLTGGAPSPFLSLIPPRLLRTEQTQRRRQPRQLTLFGS